MYRLLKKRFGTGRVSLDIKFKFDKDILDICVVDGGVLFIAKDYSAIGFIDDSGNVDFEWMGNPEISKMKNGDRKISRFVGPAAIFADNQFVYILDDNGKYLRSIDFNQRYAESITGKSYIDYFEKFCKEDSRLYGVSLGRNRFYFSSSKANKCFGIQNGKMGASIGDGRPRFCSSMSPKGCSFNNPMGIAFNSGRIYISDNKNTCIRSYNMNTGAITVDKGCPPESRDESCLESPSKIVFKRNELFILDNGKVKFTNNEMHNSEETIAFDMDEKLNAYILEKSCEQ
jgi:hypothetical protein